jgi:hypothetical protein
MKITLFLIEKFSYKNTSSNKIVLQETSIVLKKLVLDIFNPNLWIMKVTNCTRSDMFNIMRMPAWQNDVTYKQPANIFFFSTYLIIKNSTQQRKL